MRRVENSGGSNKSRPKKLVKLRNNGNMRSWKLPNPQTKKRARELVLDTFSKPPKKGESYSSRLRAIRKKLKSEGLSIGTSTLQSYATNYAREGSFPKEHLGKGPIGGKRQPLAMAQRTVEENIVHQEMSDPQNKADVKRVSKRTGIPTNRIYKILDRKNTNPDAYLLDIIGRYLRENPSATNTEIAAHAKRTTTIIPEKIRTLDVLNKIQAASKKRKQNLSQKEMLSQWKEWKSFVAEAKNHQGSMASFLQKKGF